MNLFITAPVTKMGVRLVAPDGTAIDPDITGCYDVTQFPAVAHQNWDFTKVTPRGWVAPSGPVVFSTPATIPGLSANTYSTAPPGGSDDPTSQAWMLSTPVMVAAKISAIGLTFAGSFAGGEVVTAQLIPVYDPQGPNVAPILISASSTGTQNLLASQLAHLATNKNSPLIGFVLQLKSSVNNSSVTAVAAFATT